MKQVFKKIGIIGGAGPMASCLLYQYIIEYCQQTYHCKDDCDFPEILLVSYPFAPMVCKDEASAHTALITNQLQTCFDSLSQQDADIIGIACNTLHMFLPQIAVCNDLYVNIIDCVKKAMQELSCNSFVLLGTQTTVHSGIYSNSKKQQILLSPEQQAKITTIINRILAGIYDVQDVITINAMLKGLSAQKSFSTVVLGCTELSVIHKNTMTIGIDGVTTIDPLALLAKNMIEMAIKSRENHASQSCATEK